jgi:hypothetical protein
MWRREAVDVRDTIIRLIEPSIALADARSRTPEYLRLRPAAGGARDGYWFRAFDEQDDGVGPSALRNDTDGPDFYGAVHDRSRFAFMAFPRDLDAGRVAFIVNADNTVWPVTLAEAYRATVTPLTATAESSSRFAGRSPLFLDDARVYPFMGGQIGAG